MHPIRESVKRGYIYLGYNARLLSLRFVPAVSTSTKQEKKKMKSNIGKKDNKNEKSK